MRRFPPPLTVVLLLLACEGGPPQPTGFNEAMHLEDPEPPSEEPERVRLVTFARPLVWEIEPLPTYGGMSDWMLAGVEGLLTEHAAELVDLYSARLHSNPVCSGVITAHLTTESGVLLFLSLEDNTTGDEALATRILSRMQGWDWPSSGRDVFRIHLHLRRCEGEGFLSAGSRELRPPPKLPPPPVVEDEVEESRGDHMTLSEESRLAMP